MTNQELENQRRFSMTIESVYYYPDPDHDMSVCCALVLTAAFVLLGKESLGKLLYIFFVYSKLLVTKFFEISICQSTSCRFGGNIYQGSWFHYHQTPSIFRGACQLEKRISPSRHPCYPQSWCQFSSCRSTGGKYWKG